ncbi:MAG: hypothetical protein KGI80_06400 [Verrucomicrobiota bacterium]|nr:hypothetical protein [Verrucomicrobiota bacterium]
MTHEDLIKKIAQLETINDQLTAEFAFLDRIAKELGFTEGLQTLKSAALELLEEQKKKGGT